MFSPSFLFIMLFRTTEALYICTLVSGVPVRVDYACAVGDIVQGAAKAHGFHAPPNALTPSPLASKDATATSTSTSTTTKASSSSAAAASSSSLLSSSSSSSSLVTITSMAQDAALQTVLYLTLSSGHVVALRVPSERPLPGREVLARMCQPLLRIDLLNEAAVTTAMRLTPSRDEDSNTAHQQEPVSQGLKVSGIISVGTGLLAVGVYRLPKRYLGQREQLAPPHDHDDSMSAIVLLNSTAMPSKGLRFVMAQHFAVPNAAAITTAAVVDPRVSSSASSVWSLRGIFPNPLAESSLGRAGRTLVAVVASSGYGILESTSPAAAANSLEGSSSSSLRRTSLLSTGATFMIMSSLAIIVYYWCFGLKRRPRRFAVKRD